MTNRTAYLQTMISLASAAFGVVAALVVRRGRWDSMRIRKSPRRCQAA